MEFEHRSNRRFMFGIVLIVFGTLWMLEKLRILPEPVVTW